MEKIEKLNNFIVKNILFVLIIFIFLYLFGGVGGSNQNLIQNEVQYDSLAPKTMMLSNSAPMAVGVNSRSISNSKMIKTFTLSIEAKNVSKTKDDILKMVDNDGGIIEGFYTYNYYGNEIAYNYTLKIPTEKIESAITYFKSLGVVKNESSSAIDMAERYTDNKNRLKNLYTRRDRLRKMMENKTEKLADVIAVDRELNNVQNEIESLESANKNIDNNVSYSKLELSILPEVKIDNFNNSKWQISNSWKKAINDSIIFTQKTIDFVFKVVTFIPIILVFLIIFIVIRAIIVKVFKKG